jgi:SpoVK/Ycf46/Vps4 family AAA+-type ATPase
MQMLTACAMHSYTLHMPSALLIIHTTAACPLSLQCYYCYSIDTSDFLADGMPKVASRLRYVFDKLKVLERTVILFDEIEEFALNREDKSLAMESRMLTTAMLTQVLQCIFPFKHEWLLPVCTVILPIVKCISTAHTSVATSSTAYYQLTYTAVTVQPCDAPVCWKAYMLLLHTHTQHTIIYIQQLNDLRRQQKSIFLIATNRLKSFDAAITRPGRIDLILFLGTPSLQSRLQRLDDALVTSGLKEADRSEARELTARFMDSAWESDLMFFNYRYHILVGYFTFSSVALQRHHHSWCFRCCSPTVL